MYLLLPIDITVGILDPCHRLLICAHIRSQNVILRSNKGLLCQLHCVLPRNFLQLGIRVLAWIHPDSSLGASKRNIRDCQLKSHQRSQSYRLLQCQIWRIPCPTLHRHEMVLVLRSIASQSFYLACVPLNWYLESQYMIACHEVLQVIGWDCCP